MSFKELAAANVARRQKPVSLTMKDGKILNFTANEISYLQRVDLGLSSRLSGSDMHTALIAMSLTDEEGAHMTIEQAHALSSEHQEVFYRAALDVNSLNEESKKKVKPA